MAATPTIFLDVDGVLNAFCHRDRHRGTPDCFPDLRMVELEAGFDVVVSCQMGRALRDTFDGCEVVWLTAWRSLAPKVIAPLMGLPDWPVLDHRNKIDAVARHMSGTTRPFVWIDDDHAVPSATTWFRSVPQMTNPHLLIAPDPNFGVRPSQVAEIDSWLDAPVPLAAQAA